MVKIKLDVYAPKTGMNRSHYWEVIADNGEIADAAYFSTNEEAQIWAKKVKEKPDQYLPRQFLKPNHVSGYTKSSGKRVSDYRRSRRRN